MTKTHTTITVDPDNLAKAKAMNINISGEFDKFVKAVDIKREENAGKLAKARAKIAKK